MGQNGTEYRPTTAEKKLLEVMLNPDHRHKSVVAICDLAECNRKAYYRAFEKPEFMALYKGESKRMVERSVAPVLHAFVKQAIAGSHKHGVTILEMAGMLGGEAQDDTTPAPTRVEIVVQDARKET